MLTEKQLTNKLMDFIKICPKSFVIKAHGNVMQGAGLPDLIGSYKGIPFAVEMKLPGCKPRIIQQATLSQFERGGYVVGVVSYIEDFINLFDK